MLRRVRAAGGAYGLGRRADRRAAGAPPVRRPGRRAAAVQRGGGRGATCSTPSRAAASACAACRRGAELVLAVGTTLGRGGARLSLVPPLLRLRLGLRPSLRFPVGAGAPVRRLALAGVITLAGQQLVAAVALRLAQRRGAARHAGGLRRRADGLPAAVGGAGRAAGDLGVSGARRRGRDRRRRRLPPRAGAGGVAAVVVSAVAARACWPPRPGRWPGVLPARAGRPGLGWATRNTVLAFAPGLLGYGLVAVLTRALYARGPVAGARPCCVAGRLAARGRRRRGPRPGAPGARPRGGAGRRPRVGVTVAGLALAVVVAGSSPAGRRGLARAGRRPALVGAVAGAGGARSAVLRAAGAGRRARGRRAGWPPVGRRGSWWPR